MVRWCWAKAVKFLWKCGCTNVYCKNRATRNYQRATTFLNEI